MVAIAAAAALAAWLFIKTSDPDPAHKPSDRWSERKPRTRYAELVAARREVERRMEDLRGGGLYYRHSEFKDETFQQLCALHAEIEAQLKDLKG